MRYLLALIIIIGFSVRSKGQLFSISDHYAYGSLAINPAFAGSRGALYSAIMYRKYNIGFEGTPETMSFLLHAPLKQKKIGLGLVVMRDVIGVTEDTKIELCYAYRINMGRGSLSMGLGVGLAYSKSLWNRLDALDAGDEQLYNNYSSGLLPNFNGGIYYSTPSFFMGLSIPVFMKYEFDATEEKYDNTTQWLENFYFFNMGYILTLHPDFKLCPAVLYKYSKDISQFDLNLQVVLKNKIWLGTAYRSQDIMVGMLQYQVNHQLRVAYSYDFIIGDKAEYKYNSYEIMLSYIFNYQAKVSGPRNF